MARRQFLAQLLGLPFLSLGAKAEEPKKKMLKIMMKSAWGSDDPTKAAFPFLHGLALAEAGHEVQIFLLGEATSLSCPLAGRRSAKRLKKLWPNTFPSLLEEPAAGPVGSRKQMLLNGAQNLAIPRFSWAWWSGPTASSPSELCIFCPLFEFAVRCRGGTCPVGSERPNV